MEEKSEIIEEDEIEDDKSCPVCGSYYLVKEGRCTTCFECGWSKCDL